MGKRRSGEHAYDPTQNVTSLVAAAERRLDDLRELEARHVMAMFDLHAKHQEQLDAKETQRIDANRQFDQLAVNTLAATTKQDAQTLRDLVATTANAQAASQNAITVGVYDRLSKLEERSYKGEGRGGGMSALYGWVLGGIGMLLGIGGLVFAVWKAAIGHP